MPVFCDGWFHLSSLCLGFWRVPADSGTGRAHTRLPRKPRRRTSRAKAAGAEQRTPQLSAARRVPRSCPGAPRCQGAAGTVPPSAGPSRVPPEGRRLRDEERTPRSFPAQKRNPPPPGLGKSQPLPPSLALLPPRFPAAAGRAAVAERGGAHGWGAGRGIAGSKGVGEGVGVGGSPGTLRPSLEDPR